MIASLTTTAVVAAPPGRQGECGKQEISGWTASTTLSSLADKARQSNPSADHACWELLSNGDGHAVPSHQVAGAPVTTYLEHYRPGDLLKFPRRFYDHWAMYAGEKDGTYYVIHLWSAEEELSMRHARVCVTPLHHVPNWESMLVSNKWDRHYKPFQGQEAVSRAVRRLGQGGYNLALNNCEHFVTWARHGAKISDQVHSKSSPPAVLIGAVAGAAVGPHLLAAGPLAAGLLGCATVLLAKGLLRRAIHSMQHRFSRSSELHYRHQTRTSYDRRSAAVDGTSSPTMDLLTLAPQSTMSPSQQRCWTLFHTNSCWDGRRKGMPERPPWLLVSAITRARSVDVRHNTPHPIANEATDM